jgi:hypothetical protein
VKIIRSLVRKSMLVLACAVRSIRSSTGKSTRRYARLQKMLQMTAIVLVHRKALHQKDSMPVLASRIKVVTCSYSVRNVKLGFGVY